MLMPVVKRELASYWARIDNSGEIKRFRWFSLDRAAGALSAASRRAAVTYA